LLAGPGSGGQLTRLFREMRRDEGVASRQQVLLDEKATISELVLAATKHVAEQIHVGRLVWLSPWLLHFREKSIGRAYESRQIGTAFTVVILSAFMAIVGSSVRLIRVSLGTETAPGAYEALQIWVMISLMLVHLFVGGCAIYVRNTRLEHARLLLTMATMSATTATMVLHINTREVFVAMPCASVEVWIVAIVLGFATSALAVQASVPVGCQVLIGFVIWQPMFVSPHLKPEAKGLVAVFLAGLTLCTHQSEKDKRLAFIHELELLSQCQKSAADNVRIERQLAQTEAKNSCLEERIRASELLKQINTKLTRTEIERAKLQLSCVISADLNLWGLDDSEEVSTMCMQGIFKAFKVTPVQRSAKEKEAWSDDGITLSEAHTIGDQEGQATVKMPCLAVTSLNGKNFTAKLLRNTGLAQQRVIKAGTHPFVALKGEPYVRVGIVAHEFGAASGHPLLASEANVLYAGEMEFDSEQVLTRWNNLSGTYKCSDDMAFQAGLPLDKFYSIHSGAIPRETNGDAKPGFEYVGGCDEVWLKKVLPFTESELITVHNQWVGHIRAFLEMNADANSCHDTMKRLSAQMCDATDHYGLFNYL